MKRICLLIGSALVLALTVAAARSQTATAGDGLVRTTWPSAEDPGPPFYARIEPPAPYVFHDGEWAAVVFYRDPECDQIQGFNLLNFFDPPAAFACPSTVHGTNLWVGAPQNGAPKIAHSNGNGAVPVWFIPADVINQATGDGELTIEELAGLDGLIVGHADQFDEVLHPHPLPPALGGGGHPNPKLIQNAQGWLEDGRRFSLHVTEIDEEVKAIQIQFR
ncbi:MAG: hypothetical protein R3248_10370 [Candidatus Promineifilaceae bacterium]|nr:hypothetical protein [Candidatus Promineifilaceae bacterium]